MKILFFTHYFPPEVNAPASRTYETCKRWVAAGHQVTVITGAPNAPDGVLFAGYQNKGSSKTIDGINVIRVRTYLAANSGTVKRIANYVSYMLSASLRAIWLPRPDITIATSPQFFCGWAGIITKWLKRKPFVLEIRDIWPESILAVGAMKRGRLVRLLEWLELKMYASATHIVTVGKGYARRLSEKGVEESRISVITNGVDRDFFSPREPDEAWRNELNIRGRFICTYAGTIGMACGLAVLLEAAQLLKAKSRLDILFLIAGDGAVRKQLHAQVHEQGMENQIRFLGRMPKDDMPRLYCISDCSLIHLRATDLFQTVLPSKIFETAHMHLPIIMGVAGEAAEVIKQSGGGICIEPDNAQQLVDAVLKLADDADLRQTLGNAGHQYVAKHYDRDRLAKDYLAVLMNITGQR